MERKILRTYYPWPDFPTISLSGRSCALSCDHCKGHYLSFMQDASTPEKFFALTEQFHKDGQRGFLASGGCDAEGKMINLEKMLPSIKKAIKDHDLIVKLHTGLVNREQAELIASSGIQIASMEMLGDRLPIKSIFHIPASPTDYLQSFEYLEAAGVPYISPHVVIGLPYGNGHETKALQILKENVKVDTLSMVVFRPTPGTPTFDHTFPLPSGVANIIGYARTLFPDKKIILAALRPRPSEEAGPRKILLESMEKMAIDAGIDGIEAPGKAAMEYALEEYRVKRIESFGVLPKKLEKKVRSQWLNG